MNKLRILQESANLPGDLARKKQSGVVHRHDDFICGIHYVRLGNGHYAIIRFTYFAEQPPESDGHSSGDDANGNTIRGCIY